MLKLINSPLPFFLQWWMQNLICRIVWDPPIMDHTNVTSIPHSPTSLLKDWLSCQPAIKLHS